VGDGLAVVLGYLLAGLGLHLVCLPGVSLMTETLRLEVVLCQPLYGGFRGFLIRHESSTRPEAWPGAAWIDAGHSTS
jgi:hypothetical protein